MRILVIRDGALGDVILTTPIVRRLRRDYPDAEIVVQTWYTDVFRNNPYCTATRNASLKNGWDKIIDLNGAYERSPRMHIVAAYMLEAFGDFQDDLNLLRQELFYEWAPLIRFDPYQPFIAVHAARAGWKNRTLPTGTWEEVVHLLKQAGCHPVLVGTPNDALPGRAHDAFDVPDILAQTKFISSCVCFVGSDTSLLHAAGATNTPIVGVFTSVNPTWRLPFRENCMAVVPNLPCIFCHERQPAPATSESCEYDGTTRYLACVREVEAEMIVEAVLNFVQRS